MIEALTVRSIAAGELSLFASLFGSPEAATRLEAWVRERWQEQESRAEWCFIVERAGVPIGRLLYWSFPTSPTELVLAGLQLDWQGEYREAGLLLLRQSLLRLRAEGGRTLAASRKSGR